MLTVQNIIQTSIAQMLILRSVLSQQCEPLVRYNRQRYPVTSAHIQDYKYHKCWQYISNIHFETNISKGPDLDQFPYTLYLRYRYTHAIFLKIKKNKFKIKSQGASTWTLYFLMPS